MGQRSENKETILDNIYRRVIDTSIKNWEKISLNDFGVQYSQNFIITKRKRKDYGRTCF